MRWRDHRASGDRGAPQYDARFFDALRAQHASAEQNAKRAEEESLQWPRGTDEVETLLGRAAVARESARRISNQLDSATSMLRTRCNIWGFTMPDCDENGWVAGSSSDEGRAR